MLYFTPEVFHHLANQIHGNIRVMLEYFIYIIFSLTRVQLTSNKQSSIFRKCQ